MSARFAGSQCCQGLLLFYLSVSSCSIISSGVLISLVIRVE